VKNKYRKKHNKYSETTIMKMMVGDSMEEEGLVFFGLI